MPLLVNLLLAAVVRAAIPYTVAEGGERYRYYLMQQFFPIRGCNAFHCFRILPPLVASLVPTGAIDAFLVTGFVFQVAAGTMLWLIAEHLHGSRRVAILTTVGFWLTWGAMHSFSDPLLITDPVQAFWSFAALYLLLTERYVAALPLLILGATVKESVLLVPAIYALYAWFTAARTPRRLVWLGALVIAPAAAWLVLRRVLHQLFGYVTAGDSPYLLQMPGLDSAPGNIATAIAYMYGAYGALWVLGALGLRTTSRSQRVLSLASLPAMVFLSLYQSPDRALACFPYAVMLPAAVFIQWLPTPWIAALFVTNAALIVVLRRGATFWWLPRTPVVVLACLVLIVAAVYAVRLSRSTNSHDQRSSNRPLRMTHPRRERLITASVMCFVAALTGLIVWRGATAGDFVPVPTTSGVTVVDDEGGTPGLAMAPDGSRFVWVGESAAGRQLWLQSTRGGPATAIAGTLDASEPFWSADGESVGFFAHGTLKSIQLDTGAINTLAPAPAACGGTWSRSAHIVFAPDCAGGLFTIAATGGAARPITTPDRARGGRAHSWPSFFPDGDHFVFLVLGASRDESGLMVGSLASGRSEPIVDRSEPPVHAITNAVYAAPGLLWFPRSDGVWIQPFDARRMMALSQREQFTTAVASSSTGRGAFAVGGEALVFAVRPTAPGAPASLMMSRRWKGALVDRR